MQTRNAQVSEQAKGFMNLAILMADVSGSAILPAELVAQAFRAQADAVRAGRISLS